MEISAKDVKALRDKTGAGMMDCKKALVEASGDMEKAEKILKEMGLAAVAKRQDRATENGRVFVSTDGKRVVMLSLTCETDFVASNKDFESLGEDMCSVILKKGYKEINDELVGMVNAKIAIIKENMTLKKFSLFDIPSSGYAATYLHGEGAVAVSVFFTSNKSEVFKDEKVQEFCHDLALHAAAFKPQYLSQDVVEKSYEEEQLGIFRVQVKGDEELSKKPEKVQEGIIRGKLSKLYKEICFLDQAFVKDDSKSVGQALKELSNSVGSEIKISSYAVYTAGV